MPDTATPVATDVDLLLMVRSARTQGLPQPIGVYLGYDNTLDLHTNQADTTVWRDWWTQNGAADWATRHVDQHQRRHHYLETLWRGLRVQITWITEVPA